MGRIKLENAGGICAERYTGACIALGLISGCLARDLDGASEGVLVTAKWGLLA